jgi:hypothetical protein
MRGASSSLPQDEVTAAVILGALLARNFAAGWWPGEYRAVVRFDDGRCPVEIAEEDPRVKAARERLFRLGQYDYGEMELRMARAAAAALAPKPETPRPSAASRERGV